MGLSPWQFLLWIAGLELISIPLLIFLMNAIFVAWFRLKELHQIKVIRSIGEAMESISKKYTDMMSDNKEETKSES